jgi:hypothetical protein
MKKQSRHSASVATSNPRTGSPCRLYKRRKSRVPDAPQLETIGTVFVLLVAVLHVYNNLVTQGCICCVMPAVHETPASRCSGAAVPGLAPPVVQLRVGSVLVTLKS